jgi:redox-sensitive bicupin YhaK (pirin superfamily)
MRTIKQIHPAKYCPIEDLITYSPLPSENTVQIDPFLALNHHGPQCFIPENNGLPFGPHPHRGIETVTLILEGEILHKDASGNEVVIKSGGIQWVTAGRGMIHAVTATEEFKEHGGRLEFLQVLLNLPAKHKMILPRYISLQKEQIPSIKTDKNRIEIRLIAGSLDNQKGVIETISDITMALIKFKPEGRLRIAILKEFNIFFYVVSGSIRVNNKQVDKLNLVEFNMDQELLDIVAIKESVLFFGFAKPLNEPVVINGPFVMNNDQEIRQAYKDFYRGKMGRL